ncbi:hypothetical protein [Desulfobacter latus]|uniref:Uncharacterized protein n=1 Tax=Desulfobacter latus TaxID=2292 RepID=A0A850TEQ4_9BACT|nr:hypothetical protein [Desulfobacter latus]NWH06767.1 hypothetical protein [Desulfobacter latus]
MKNKLNRTLEQINASLVNAIIFCIGFICLLVVFFVKHPDYRNILLSIGCSLIASSVVSFLTSKYLVRMNRIKRIVEYWGLEAIYETRQEMNRSTDIAFESLEKNLDIIAWGLKSFRDAKDKIVREKVKRGLKIRFVTLHPDSEYVKQREIDEKEASGQIRHTILNLQNWIDDLKTIAPKPENIQIKYYNSLPEDFYFRVDDHVFIGPYLWGISSQQTISYEFKGSTRGTDYYKDYFERLWNATEFYTKPG